MEQCYSNKETETETKRAREKMGEGVVLNREPLKALNESDQKSM